MAVNLQQFSHGDSLRITTKTATYEGTLLPRPETLSDAILILKLKNGYNIGIAKNTITAVELLKKHHEKSHETEKKAVVKLKTDAKRKTIAILHTGGTIASKVDYTTGAVIAKFTPEDMIQQIPELKTIANIKSAMITNIQSESMRAGHYNLIAKAIEKEIKSGAEGIIITHGTDTLHYTSAALSFILEHLSVPVLLVGAQRSSDRGSSDAFMNVLCAVKFITQTSWNGVGICMHSSSNDDNAAILSGTKARKLHTSRRDAFRAVNALPIAEVSYKTDEVTFFTPLQQSSLSEKLTLKFFKENLKVGLMKTHTFTFPEDYLHYKNHDGLIIEGTGLGHAQAKGFDAISALNEENKKAIAEVAKKIPVVMTSQCIYGRVNMNVYTPQRELLELRVIPGEDMTAETALIKLAWLLSSYNNKEEVKQLMRINLRGEITERTVVEEQVIDQ